MSRRALAGDVAEERLTLAAGERAHVADAERRAGDRAAARARRRALPLQGRARERPAALQVRHYPHLIALPTRLPEVIGNIEVLFLGLQLLSKIFIHVH